MLIAQRLIVMAMCCILPSARTLTLVPSRAISVFGHLRAAAHHLAEPAQHQLQSSTATSLLEQLANTRIPSSAIEADILAFVARPKVAPDGELPLLVVLHEFFGLSEGICSKAQLLADELCCVVVCPDCFRGVTTSFVPRAIWLALTTGQQQVNNDLEDVLTWAKAQDDVDGDKVGIMGFCWGGGKAIRYTTECQPKAATCIYYGSPLIDSSALAALSAPVTAVYGCEDMQFPQSLVNKFKEALEEAGVEHEVVSYYGVGHAFWKDVGQIEREEMPQTAAYRLMTTSLRNFYTGKESFAAKKRFLEFMLAESGRGEVADESLSTETILSEEENA